MPKINRIFIFGASGSGTTTFGRDLSTELNYVHFDTDSYFWLPTTPPFQQKRAREARVAMLGKDLTSTEKWVLSGSMPGWGDRFIPLFDLAVYLYIPPDIRINRLTIREAQTFGAEEIKLGGQWHQHFQEFIDWAASYDDGDLTIRSKALHAEWMKLFTCPILRIEGDTTREERVQRVLQRIQVNKGVDVDE